MQAKLIITKGGGLLAVGDVAGWSEMDMGVSVVFVPLYPTFVLCCASFAQLWWFCG